MAGRSLLVMMGEQEVKLQVLPRPDVRGKVDRACAVLLISQNTPPRIAEQAAASSIQTGTSSARTASSVIAHLGRGSCLPSFRFNDGDGPGSCDGSGWSA